MKANAIKIAVIIPAYNESPVIKDVLRGIHVTLKKRSINHQIILIDDRSSDNTAKLASTEKAYVIQHLLNTGSGGATATGLRYARDNRFQIAATIDADGQHNPRDLAKGIDQLLKQGGDLLIGSRLINPEGMPILRQVGNKWLSTFTYILFGVRVTDSQSGLRIFSQKALNSIQLKSTGYEFCSEMLWRAKQKKLTIGEFPIQPIYTPYSLSKGQRSWNAVKIIKILFKQRVIDIFYE